MPPVIRHLESERAAKEIEDANALGQLASDHA
jgi:hypothetical protein